MRFFWCRKDTGYIRGRMFRRKELEKFLRELEQSKCLLWLRMRERYCGKGEGLGGHVGDDLLLWSLRAFVELFSYEIRCLDVDGGRVS